MMLFYICVAAAIVVALTWMLRSLLSKQPEEAPARETANLAIFKNQLAELNADQQAGILSLDQYEQAKLELESRVLDEAVPAANDEAPRGSVKAVAIMLALFIIIGSISLYNLIGEPDAIVEASNEGLQFTPHQVDDMIAQLALRMEKNPDDAKGWGILARSYYALERYEESARAYEQLLKLVPQDANLLADYADALAMAKGRDLRGRPTELLRQALKLDPTQWKALLLLGSEAFERGDYRSALKYWEPLLATVPADTELAQQLRGAVDQARTHSTQRKSSVAVAAGSRSIHGTVRLAPQLAAQVGPEDVLFVFARPASGSKIPLAVLRLNASQLPAAFELNDAQAMRPDMRLSQHEAVIVGARISKSGNPLPQSGDLEGYSATIKPGVQNLQLLIDKKIP